MKKILLIVFGLLLLVLITLLSIVYSGSDWLRFSKSTYADKPIFLQDYDNVSSFCCSDLLLDTAVDISIFRDSEYSSYQGSFSIPVGSLKTLISKLQPPSGKF